MYKSLTYVSNATLPMNKEELERILKKSLKNNGVLGLTGMLVYHDSTFIQVLEGPEDALDKLFNTIKNDERHHNVVILDISFVAEREFGKWEMGFRYLDEEDVKRHFSSFQDLEKLLKSPADSNAKTILKTFYELNIKEVEMYAKHS